MLIYFGKLLDGYENCKTVQ
jgi:hypothetical protein